MTRRSFLSGAAACGVAGSLPSGAQTSERVPLLILGAGIAGLTAGFELQQKGREVVLLEARMRPGGRVHTLREPFSDSLYAEAGAIFVYDVHNLVQKYVRQFGLTLDEIPARHMSGMYHVRGKLVRNPESPSAAWPLQLSAAEARAGLYAMQSAYLYKDLATPEEARSPNWPPARLRDLDGMSVADMMRRRGASEEAVSLLRLGYPDLWGDGIETVSALSLIRDASIMHGTQKQFTIRGGSSHLPRALASKLKDRIRYGAAVTKIEPLSGAVRVSYRQGGLERRIEANRVICTLPFTVLRTIPVEPAFDAEKTRAINELATTSVTRVFVQQKVRTWEQAGITGSATTDLPIMWTRDVTFNQPGPRGLLESYMAGPQARRAGSMKEEDRIAMALEHLAKIYPGLREHHEGGASYTWDADPWAKGDYAYLKPGQSLTILPHVARPAGRVHFAGDHASPSPGWMQGAMESALRVVEEVGGS
jgi:monoamine oxidase